MNYVDHLHHGGFWNNLVVIVWIIFIMTVFGTIREGSAGLWELGIVLGTI